MKMRFCVLASVAVLTAAALTGRGAENVEGRGGRAQLALGKAAPEILATDLEGKGVTLEKFKGKPVVLEFGSLTEPWFRARMGAVEKLAGKYGEKVQFVVVYSHEAHAADSADAIEENATDGFALAKPTTEVERVKAASQAKERLHIENALVAVDAWNNTTSLRYGDYPNMAFVIDGKGDLQAGYPWMDPKKVQGAVDALLAGKEVPVELRGPVHAKGAGQDFGEVAMDMTGYAQGAKLVKVLDGIQMTDEQKKAVLPPLLDFMAQARNYREVRSGSGKGNVAGVGANAKGVKGAATQPEGSGEKAVTAEEMQGLLEKLRASATTLKHAVNENLPAKDAQALMDAVEQGPGKRLFADN